MSPIRLYHCPLLWLQPVPLRWPQKKEESGRVSVASVPALLHPFVCEILSEWNLACYLPVTPAVTAEQGWSGPLKGDQLVGGDSSDLYKSRLASAEKSKSSAGISVAREREPGAEFQAGLWEAPAVS